MPKASRSPARAEATSVRSSVVVTSSGWASMLSLPPPQGVAGDALGNPAPSDLESEPFIPTLRGNLTLRGDYCPIRAHTRSGLGRFVACRPDDRPADDRGRPPRPPGGRVDRGGRDRRSPRAHRPPPELAVGHGGHHPRGRAIRDRRGGRPRVLPPQRIAAAGGAAGGRTGQPRGARAAPRRRFLVVARDAGPRPPPVDLRRRPHSVGLGGGVGAGRPGEGVARGPALSGPGGAVPAGLAAADGLRRPPPRLTRPQRR